ASDGTTGSTVVSDAGGYGVKLAPGRWTLTLSGGALRQPQTIAVDVGTSNVLVDFVVPDNPGQPVKPVISPVPNQTSNRGDAVALQVSATNADNFTATGLPGGLQIDRNGRISGTIAAGAAGTSTVTVTAFNGGVASDPVSFTWTVSAAYTVSVDPRPM